MPSRHCTTLLLIPTVRVSGLTCVSVRDARPPYQRRLCAMPESKYSAPFATCTPIPLNARASPTCASTVPEHMTQPNCYRQFPQACPPSPLSCRPTCPAPKAHHLLPGKPPPSPRIRITARPPPLFTSLRTPRSLRPDHVPKPFYIPPRPGSPTRKLWAFADHAISGIWPISALCLSRSPPHTAAKTRRGTGLLPLRDIPYEHCRQFTCPGAKRRWRPIATPPAIVTASIFHSGDIPLSSASARRRTRTHRCIQAIL